MCVGFEVHANSWECRRQILGGPKLTVLTGSEWFEELETSGEMWAVPWMERRSGWWEVCWGKEGAELFVGSWWRPNTWGRWGRVLVEAAEQRVCRSCELWSFLSLTWSRASWVALGEWAGGRLKSLVSHFYVVSFSKCLNVKWKSNNQ